MNRLSVALFNPDIDCRAISIRLDSAPIFPEQMTRRVSIPAAPLARHSHENPAIFTDNASLPPVIGRDKNAWRTHGQMQRKV
ncbi:hypothetical protein [Burkholderia sp. Ac-20392]|uniref:hypothetical protein n=1 Tax=Burkholderia sp. Ac-20392 TaxID=2703905 RepID=UPI00197F568E|nr:hypothetical protein [Burkholderia sp. Ac-20392]MBN3799108.1 hypothetical protein [Burkholderia sp. Ac-20392]